MGVKGKRLSEYKQKAIEKALTETRTSMKEIAEELDVCGYSVMKIKQRLGHLSRDDKY